MKTLKFNDTLNEPVDMRKVRFTFKFFEWLYELQYIFECLNYIWFAIKIKVFEIYLQFFTKVANLSNKFILDTKPWV